MMYVHVTSDSEKKTHTRSHPPAAQMADGSFNKRGMSLRMYLAEANDMRKRRSLPLTSQS